MGGGIAPEPHGGGPVTAVAFLGLGRMGGPMAANIARAGHDLTVWNRSPAAAAAFAAEHRAVVASCPADAVAGADVVFTMLADDRALLDTYDGAGGVLIGLQAGAIAVDTSTVSPVTVADIAQRVADRGAAFLDAPVSGSVAAATAATLTILVGGEPRALDLARPVLSAMGTAILYIGRSGAGATMKLAVNSVVHSLNGAVAEALVLAERAGIDRTTAYTVFLNSAIAAPFVQYRQGLYERPQDAEVAFKLSLAAKDLRLALELAERVGAELPQADRNYAVLQRAIVAGMGDRDESAVAVYLRERQHP